MKEFRKSFKRWRRRVKLQRNRWLTRWRATRMAGGRTWQTVQLASDHGFAANGIDHAMTEACDRLELTLVGQPNHGYLGKSRGATVRAADGALCWLKVTGITGSAAQWQRAGEEAAGQIRGVPRPAILRIVDWSADGVQWRALLMSLAPSYTAAPTPNDCPEPKAISDAWIGDLKASVEALGRLPAFRRKFNPDWVRTLLADRFNLDAQIQVEEWRTAHGDMQWSNLTAPKLMLLDWEAWGAAPRGYDAARLIAFSCASAELVERLRAAFAEELGTPSGRVTQLLICAEMLVAVENGYFNPRLHQPIESLARQVLRTV